MVFHSSSASFSSSLSHSRFSCAASSSSASASSSPSSSPSHPPFSDCSRRGIFAANNTHSSQYAAPSTVPFLWEEKPGVLKRVQGDQNPSRLYNALNGDHRTDNGNSNENGGSSYGHGGFDGNSCERRNVNGRNGDGCCDTSYDNENAKILDSRIGLQNFSHSHGKGHSHGRSSAVFQEQPRLRLPPRLLAPDHEDHVTAMKELSTTVTSGRTHRRNSSGSSISAENSRRKHRMYGSSITSQRGLSMDDDPFLLAFMVCKNEEKSFSETTNSATTRISKSIHLEEQDMHFDQCIPRMNNGKLSMKAAFSGKMSRERKLHNVRGNGPAVEGSSKETKCKSLPNHAKHNVPLCSSSSSSAVVDISCAYQHVVKSYKTKTRLFPDLLGCRTDNARLLPFQPTPLH